MTTVLLFLLSLIGPSIRPFMRGIHGSLVLWIPRRGFRVPGTQYWIPDYNLQWDSGFQSPGFPIPQAQISMIPESPRKIFTGFTYMGRFDVHGNIKMFACGTRTALIALKDPKAVCC